MIPELFFRTPLRFRSIRGIYISNTSGGIEFSSYALTYDAGLNTVGNLTGVTEQTGTVAYTYDALY